MPTLNKAVHLEALTKELIDNPGLATMTDEQVAEALSAPVLRPEVGPAEPADLARVIMEREKWQTLRDASDATTVVGKAARALWAMLTSPHISELRSDSGELKRLVVGLRAAGVLDDDDVAAIRAAFTRNVAGPSRGQALGIGQIYWQFVWQVRHPGARFPWAATFEGPGHALAFADASGQVITSQTINAAAESLSAEQALAADTIVPGIRYYFTVTGFAAAPTGTMLARIQPYYATGGTAFDDFTYTTPFTVSADAQYDFTGWFPNQIARWFKFGIKNNSTQNTDASAVSAWLWYQGITA